jgi:two-component SAPR family response regulator
MDHIHLSKETGNWRTEIDYSNVYVDFYEFLKILENKKHITKEETARLCEITSRGSFLTSVEYPWLDQIKANIANEAIDIFLDYITHMRIENEPDFAIEVANAIFIFDAINEEAMTVKCKALACLGKHSLAKSTYKIFSKEYKDLYGEEFKSDFHAIVTIY